MRRVGGLLAVAGLAFGLAGCDIDASDGALPVVESVTLGSQPGTVLVQTGEVGAPAEHYLVLDVDAHLLGTGTPTVQPVLTADCAGDDCYRVARTSLEVDESHGGEYRTAWSITGVQYQRLVWSYYLSGEPTENVASKSVVVLNAPGGHVVFVANRRDGLLFRASDGTWHRLGTPRATDAGTLAFDPPTRMPIPLPRNPRLAVAAIFSAVEVAAVALVCRFRKALPRPPGAAVVVGAIGYQAWAVAAVTTHYTQGRDLVLQDGIPLFILMLTVGVLASVTLLGRPDNVIGRPGGSGRWPGLPSSWPGMS